MTPHRSARRIPRLVPLLAALLACTPLLPAHAQGQATDDSGWRFGVSFGGVSTFGITVERIEGNQGFELTVGTWSFRDVSLSPVYKRYILSDDVKPFFGAGLWLVAARPPDERLGMALVLRVPVGVDVTLLDDHHFDATLNINRGLAVRRTDAEDDIPLNKRLVPLPGVGYRYEIR